MPTAGDLCGGFFDVAYQSPVLDAYAQAAYGLGENAVGTQRPAVKAWVLKVSDMTLGAADNGRAVFDYPAPPTTPVWISGNQAGTGAKFLIKGVDFDVTSTTVSFDEDPAVWATSKHLVWVDGVPENAVTLWYGEAAVETAVAVPPAGSVLALGMAAAEACDSPAAAVDGEVVEEVWEAPDGWRVVTDSTAYKLPAAETPSVEVGYVLRAGDPIGTAWSLTKLGPAKPSLTHFTTPADFHQGVLTGGITWYDENVSLVIDTESSRCRVRWRMGAASQDELDDFWAESHARGITAGYTSLAYAMDTRTNPTTEPTPASLPVVVNPLEFLCKELLAGNAYLYLTFPDRFGENALSAAEGLANVRKAAGPFVAIFDYQEEVPALTRYTPS